MIDVSTKYIAPAEETLPALGVHITRLVGSYMVWVGVTEEGADTVGDAPRKGALCRDWACAMPSGATTTLCGAGVAGGMAGRLARRVGQVVYLSVDVAGALHGTRALLEAEKGVLESLLELSRTDPEQ